MPEKRLRIILLTTETSHHLFYASKLSERFSLDSIFVETRPAIAPFETFHAFEKKRDEYESECLLRGEKIAFSNFAETFRYADMNEPGAVAEIRSRQPEVMVVFGTGRLSEPVFSAASVIALNLHGGNPEQYRGLDSHLWSIYHSDFENLMTTLHEIDRDLDTGDIIGQKGLEFHQSAQLYELRSVNTIACVELTLAALEGYCSNGLFPRRKQTKRGRYYSFMPAVLKELCVKNFARFIRRLAETPFDE